MVRDEEASRLHKLQEVQGLEEERVVRENGTLLHKVLDFQGLEFHGANLAARNTRIAKPRHRHVRSAAKQSEDGRIGAAEVTEAELSWRLTRSGTPDRVGRLPRRRGGGCFVLFTAAA